ncbi:MAG TPA: hypothetical protein VLG92_03855 [Candidatus Saccharimonadia bacterium]|nr:hypothetical protein [Candidatus Saccharimonadia bacterium]
MSGKQSNKNHQTEDSPFNDFDLGLNVTHLVDNSHRSKKANFIEKVELKPADQRRILLGNFTAGNPPKGFSTEITPDPNPEDSVLTEVTSLGTSERYKLALHIADYGIDTVSAKIWQLQ